MGIRHKPRWLGRTGFRSHPSHSIREEPMAPRSPRSVGIADYRKCIQIARQDLVIWAGLQTKVQYVSPNPLATVLVLTTLKEDMVYLNALGQPVVVFNSLKSAAELLDRRANIYSDRPRLIMANEILSGGLFNAFLPYGDT